ncbi:ubiquitin fusion degradation protein 1 [Pyricularia oryzae 70-15]|uniref:Ubiquitin fusion degradation protein 1 n=3 Tax=Pyricularia oryzae TaxID=318829 RepID=G4NAF1_PYRO7|nr:ubiquitin fusion degradation protein 1 [Pyricularia oryzae 70-15]EHA50496.1 ubiquitin fusion degradation protein 1 [Pyricularia oryzae 70-15]ELQ43377.1 ubiquitin fusion degradation protein 1 [Pyricularia oryzae Y34]KAI7931375.1 ubiquitin fusion degradation protein 1 [Pyricularia oryzae]KAI7931636.1 ubiquitin fusion degradation protein 1 [Pyricularia oryzae]
MYASAMRGGRRPIVQRFDEYYRCYPMIMVPGAERPELNHGSKIILPPSALEKVSKLHVQWPLLMELINGENDKHTHSGVLEFVAEEGRAYLPQWMMQTLQLDVGDMIQIKSTSLELARMVKLQPQSAKFLDISDPRAVLEKAFRNFATLTKGDVFSFEYNDDVYEMAVLDVKPETTKMGVSMIETDVSVDFAAPVGYVEPERQAKGSGTSTPRSTRGGGLPAGGLLHSQGGMAQAINYDAIAPGSARSAATNFMGEGNKIGSKKGSKDGTPVKSSTPVAGVSTNPNTSGTSQDLIPRRRTNGPLPLRLPANKLFFGYEIKPVKTDAQKEEEKESAKRPHFAGQGQTLRGGAAKRKGDENEQLPTPEKRPGEGRRLDGKT